MQGFCKDIGVDKKTLLKLLLGDEKLSVQNGENLSSSLKEEVDSFKNKDSIT